MSEPIIHSFGYETYLDSAGVERYADNGEPVTYPSKRPCPKCHRLPTPDGHDPCLGRIDGAISACCGHGVTTGFVMWRPEPHSIFEVEVPGWLRLLLLFTGRRSVVTNRRPVNLVLRYYYSSTDNADRPLP